MDELAALMELSDEKNIKKAQKVATLTSEYFELPKEGDSFKGVFIGFTKCSFKDKGTGDIRQIPGIRLMYNRKIYVNAGVALVNEFERGAVPAGTLVEIVFKEKKGNAKIYEVNIMASPVS
jgi:hypothetical protein